MTDFEKLVDSCFNRKDVKEYLEAFFVRNNLKDYYIDPLLDKEEIKAIKIMFTSRKDLNDRIDDAFAYNPFCLEALFAYMMCNEDIFVHMRFDAYYQEASRYADLTVNQKRAYLRIMDFYVEFLLDIQNITGAIKIEKLLMRLGNDNSPRNINRLSFMYSVVENEKEFYNLYLNNDFDAYDYLLLIVTLLKHEEQIKAKQVLLDMFDKIPYSQYLDHLWDIADDDEKGQEFYQIVEDCYDTIESIPTFFSWVNSIKRK